MGGRATSAAFAACDGQTHPADVQQLVASARLVREALQADFDAARLPPAQYKALVLLHGALDRFPPLFPSLALPLEPGQRPPGAGSNRAFDSGTGPAATSPGEART